MREKKPELTSVLDSYEIVKKTYDQVLEEKFSLEQDIKKLEYSTAQDQSREETAKTEREDTVKRIKELSTETKHMKTTNTQNKKESGHSSITNIGDQYDLDNKIIFVDRV